MSLDTVLKKATWLESDDIRPYVFVRPENHIQSPGTSHSIDWFNKQKPIYKNPLNLKEVPFAEAIYQLEWKAFGDKNMAIPRWVFYDCAAMPGFIAGFAGRTKSLPKKIVEMLGIEEKEEWCPLSLFIIIPTMHKGEWVAYDLSSINSLLPKEDRYHGLGFLTKAFALWYANVEQCSGMTQWGSPSLKLHSNYGHIELLGSYAPLHTHAQTMTYRCEVDSSLWEKFFTKEEDLSFVENYAPTDLKIYPDDEKCMIDIQNKIHDNQGPFYLNANEVLKSKLSDPLTLYKPKKEF